MGYTIRSYESLLASEVPRTVSYLRRRERYRSAQEHYEVPFTDLLERLEAKRASRRQKRAPAPDQPAVRATRPVGAIRDRPRHPPHLQ